MATPIDMILGEHDIAQPDLLVVADPAQVSRRGIEGVPVLVVEVLSPSSRAQDRGVKLRRSAARGVAHHWILDPDTETLECLRLDGGDYRRLVQAQAPARLAHPDGPELAIDLDARWL